MNYHQQVIVSRFEKRKLGEGKERNKWRGALAPLESDKLVEHCLKIQTWGRITRLNPPFIVVGTTSIRPQADYTWWQRNRINSFYKICLFIFACAGSTCQWEFAYGLGNSNPGSVITERGGNGWEVGGRFKREGTCVHLWLMHVDVWQKSNPHCKAVIHRLQINQCF